MKAFFLSCVVAGLARADDWIRHAGIRCEEQGEQIGAPFVASVAECKRRCEGAAECAGIVVGVVNISWTTHEGLNCYAGHGARDLIDGGGTVDSCYQMTLAECQTQCYLTESCTGFAYDGIDNGGHCCLRADIRVKECEQSGDIWDTHVMTPYPAVPIPADSQPCSLRSKISIADCDTQSEDHDTYTRSTGSSNAGRWWLSTHFAERSIMPRHYSCGGKFSKKTCTLVEIRGLLDDFQAQGFSVINIDWPIDSSPDSLYEGFGARDYYAVDPLLGSNPRDNVTVLTEWHALVKDVHGRGMKIVADFNPSYFWTGAPVFKQALADVKKHGWGGAGAAAIGLASQMVPLGGRAGAGVPHGEVTAAGGGWARSGQEVGDRGIHDQPHTRCPLPPLHAPYSTGSQDDDPRDGYTDGSVWGIGQPCGDLASAEWRAELSRIFAHWVTAMGLDGFMLDAPPDYLGNMPDGKHTGLHDAVLARYIRQVMVEPVHALGAMMMGEMYNMGRPTISKMLDGGRNTDMPDGTVGFPSALRQIIVSADATQLEPLLSSTVDRYVGWYGTPRTEAWYDNSQRGEKQLKLAVLQAAVTALMSGYYVTRMGPECSSPHHSYGPSLPGDQWPGGCFGNWLDTFGENNSTADSGSRSGSGSKLLKRRFADVKNDLYTVLKLLPDIPPLHPGRRRVAAQVKGNKGVYAALRQAESANEQGNATVDLRPLCEASLLQCPQPAPQAIVTGGGKGAVPTSVPSIPGDGSWKLSIPSLSWNVYSVSHGTRN